MYVIGGKRKKKNLDFVDIPSSFLEYSDIDEKFFLVIRVTQVN
jgi:hypothetical protein